MPACPSPRRPRGRRRPGRTAGARPLLAATATALVVLLVVRTASAFLFPGRRHVPVDACGSAARCAPGPATSSPAAPGSGVGRAQEPAPCISRTLPPRWRGATALAASPVAATAGADAAYAPRARFDPEKAIKLAAYSFATYGDPTGSRWMRMPDGTNLGFQSDELVRRNFRALLLVHILKARGLPQESGGLLERALSGTSCDPYVVSSVANSFGEDIAITRAQAANSNPDFFQRFFLYVEDPGADAALALTVKDKNLLKGDDVIGHCHLPLTALQPVGGGDDDGEEEDEEGMGMMDLGIREWAGTLEITSPTGKPSGTIELELQLVPLGDEEEEGGEAEAAAREDEDEDDGSGPRSVLEDIDWNVLARRMGKGRLRLGRYEFACFLTNEETDTQGAIWCDRRAKEMIISFRGTEMGWKDLLTDALVIQEGLDGPDDKRMVHAGFRRAFRSIRGAVLQAIQFIAPDLAGWTIDVTGHSLGGALATLMAHELDRAFPDLVASDRLHVYSFGAPRVGNTAFCRDYDRRLKDVSFRVVNGLDVVARMPRGTRQPTLLSYDHCARTVLLSAAEGGRSSVWVEGESAGTCPLREVDPFANIDASSSSSSSSSSASSAAPSSFELQVPVSMATFANGTAASVQDMLRAASNLTNLRAMMAPAASAGSVGPFGALSLQTDLEQIKGALLGGALNGTAMAAKSLGLNATFVDSEMRMMESLILGDALAHHMEPLYYVALEKAIASLQEGGDQGAGAPRERG